MSLNSINVSSPSGALELLATQDKNLPGLTNTSDKPITVEINATGKWSLYRPDIAGQTGDMAKFQALVDGNGYTDEALKNPKYKYKYPTANPAALVAEIKDSQGNVKRVAAGKTQTLELQPNETVSFVANDATSCYLDNHGKLSIAYSIVSKVDPNTPVAIADLYNTGVDNARNVLGDSAGDTHYTLVAAPAGTALPVATTPNTALAPINWLGNTSTARWIGPNSASSSGPVGVFVYRTTFTLPSFSSASVSGYVTVDDQILDILINGVSVSNQYPLGSWTTTSQFQISSGFVVGVNTLEFKVNNVGGPTGLRVDRIAGTYVQSTLKATIYEHGDFQGISREVGVGSYGVSDIGFPNDVLSSLKVPQGLKVTLYEHGIDLGRSKVFTADASWVGNDFNDVTSAIKVELLTDPVIATVKPENAPAQPQNFHSPFTFTPNGAPVIQWNGYTYWAYSYADNRMAMAILAYDATGKVVKQWEKPGARYLTSIAVDTEQKTIILVGQANQKTVFPWSDLAV
jgi:hypothetical protein